MVIQLKSRKWTKKWFGITDASFIARMRQRAQTRRQNDRANAAAAAAAEENNIRRLQIRSLGESTDASVSGLMPHLLRTTAEQLDIQKRNQQILS